MVVCEPAVRKVKPRIQWQHGKWRCRTRLAYGSGMTIRAAWESMQRMRKRIGLNPL